MAGAEVVHGEGHARSIRGGFGDALEEHQPELAAVLERDA
ncbi:hypothetical protein FHX42_003290 [Saccharopolyspora lacisalsi]|uniref:Uncharacterized protein n=1 Tax=Halosaccharopolyspora lacisalsi TaxID=1000566 RepID=A0A839DWN7_9PSEU|nr:hypothetical protein [Halosaccharopolyspora lacisalsi]